MCLDVKKLATILLSVLLMTYLSAVHDRIIIITLAIVLCIEIIYWPLCDVIFSPVSSSEWRTTERWVERSWNWYTWLEKLVKSGNENQIRPIIEFIGRWLRFGFKIPKGRKRCLNVEDVNVKKWIGMNRNVHIPWT